MDAKKTDRRTRYTKTAIRQALLELLGSRPIGRITVTDICKRAEINRGTFYSYYTDPYHLLSGIENELLEKIKMSMENSMVHGKITDLLLEILKAIQQNADLCRNLFSEYGDKQFIRRIIDISRDRGIAEWKAIAGNAHPDTLELLYSYTAEGTVGIIRVWLQSGMKQSPAELADLIDKLIHHGIRAILYKRP
ncbi:MAG TPA: TetR family transcriptional regulator [Clostridiales bacterium]|nr:TetR family transcriptional regulator [Clostridiales bacterium]